MAKSIDRGALATLLGLSTGMLAGCSPSTDGQWQVCTDNAGRRIADDNCRSSSGAHGSGGGWRYISRERSAPAIGETVTQGSMMPLAGAPHAAPAEGIARGGFGGHGGEGGGHGGGE